jgi:transcriptional regulator with XRE-family HTH domain
MKVNYPNFKAICLDRGLSVSKVLKLADVSRTAFYNLLKHDSLVPKSLQNISTLLNIPVEDLLEESELKKTRRLQNKLEEVLKLYPETSRENAWHTLVLLEEPPIQRLERALIRGRKSVYPERN